MFYFLKAVVFLRRKTEIALGFGNIFSLKINLNEMIKNVNKKLVSY